MKRGILLIILSVAMFRTDCWAKGSAAAIGAEKHVEVSMRMIGHSILLSLGDSTSRVLPIEQTDNSYRISFATEFGFNPDDMAAIIDSVVAETKIAEHYVVEFKSCGTDETVYMYEKLIGSEGGLMPCRSRDEPLGCYELVITILKAGIMNSLPVETVGVSDAYENEATYLKLVFALIIVVLGGAFLFMKRRTGRSVNPNVIRIGEFQFNQLKMELTFKGERIELTSKESALLQLLHDSVNDTVERDTILKMVWGDDGDYVGRTLDVFISKLRKKLEADPNVQIANIRGIGYRLVVDHSK